MNRATKRSAAVAVAALLALGGTSGLAWSYFSTNGTGSGAAATSAGVTGMVITQTTTLTELFPGATAQPVTVTIQNTSAQSAFVQSLTPSIKSVTPATGLTCDASNYSFVPNTTAVATDIAAGATVTYVAGSLSFVNKATNQDGCKGASLVLEYVAA